MKNLLPLLFLLIISCSTEKVVIDEYADCKESIRTYLPSETDKNGLIEGDIIPDKTDKALANFSRGKLWPNNIIPYFLDMDLEKQKQNQIRQRLKFIESFTYLEFVEFTNEKDLLKVYPNGIHFRSPTNPFAGNSSFVGMQGGIQNLSLVHDSEDFVIDHETFHALGFEHEIKRADRDKNIIMLWDNIPPNPNIRRQFEIAEDATLCGDYDIKSIMHYGSFTGGWWNAEETNRPVFTDLEGNIIEQATKFSEKDIKAVNVLYPNKIKK